MATTRSVQFRNTASVVHAYQSREVAPWSIWQGSQFMFKYEGADINEGVAVLEDHLKCLSQSAAIYTLKIYEDLGKGNKIKSNTPDDGSFNFRFQDEPYGSGNGMSNPALNEVLTELRTLKVAVADLQSEEPAEDENPLGIVGHVLAIPGMSDIVAGLLGKMIGTQISAPAGPQAIAGIPGGPITSLSEALTVLTERDPLFEEHLIKLATIARDNPERFNQVIVAMRFL